MNVKFPAIISILIAIIILFNNILKKNPLFLSLIRTLVSGILVFGIVFLVYYVITDVLKIELKEKQVRQTDEKSNVDLIVDDETEQPELDIEEQPEEQSGENQAFNQEDAGSSQENPGEQGAGEIAGNSNSQELGDLSDSEQPLDQKISQLDDTDYQFDQESPEEEEEEEADYSNSPSPLINADADTVKEKLGVDASYEDLAKAIRTKMKKDD